MRKNIWVFIEIYNGVAKPVGLELLAPARQLADKTNEQVVAVVMGFENVSEIAQQVVAYGAEKVIVVKGEQYEHYHSDSFTFAFVSLIEKYNPSSILIGATLNGRDLAPRVACQIKTGLTADCTALDVDPESKDILWTRPAMGGNLMATIVCSDHRPQMGTVRPGVFKKNEPQDNPGVEIIEEEIITPPEFLKTQILDRVFLTDDQEEKIEEAEIIVSAGRGVESEDIPLIKAFAKSLGGVVGASRAAVDSGLFEYRRQIGQTGKTVSTKVYFAVGISGAIQHIAGMSSSDTIIAINQDPDAPIFKIADYGIIGDLKEIIPALMQEVEKRK